MIWRSNTRFLNKGGAEANAKSQQAFNQQLQTNYNQEFGKFNDTLQYLLDSVKPLVQAGPSQTGFSTPEEAALRSDAIGQNATNFTNASAALNQRLIAQNGGASFIPSGASAQLQEQLAAAGAADNANAQRAITEANYATGRQNYLTGLTALSTGIGALNPNAFAGAATSQGNAATNAINVANQTGWGSILTKLAGSAIGAAAGAATGGLTTGLGAADSVVSNFAPGLAQQSGLFSAAPAAPNIGAFGMPSMPNLFGGS